MSVRGVGTEEPHNLPQVTQLPGDRKNHNLRHGPLQTGATTLLNSLERAHQQPVETTTLKKLMSSPGRAGTLHLKEKYSHLGRATRQARVPFLHPTDSMAKPH